jgi:sulfide:quinone oxidoreductase
LFSGNGWAYSAFAGTISPGMMSLRNSEPTRFQCPDIDPNARRAYMVDIRRIDEDIAVAPQMSTDDVLEAANLGFRTLVANRPDKEEPGQPAMADIEAAAREHGLEWIYLPVESGNIRDDDVDQFAPVLSGASKPILAFCRSGTRCTALWALSSARLQPVDQLLTKARNAGYDLQGLKPRLEQQARDYQQKA